MIPSDPVDRDILAGEFVLGLTDAETTSEIERAMPADRDLRERVSFWEQKLLPSGASGARGAGSADLGADRA